jgi:hypothetical protein
VREHVTVGAYGRQNGSHPVGSGVCRLVSPNEYDIEGHHQRRFD